MYSNDEHTRQEAPLLANSQQLLPVAPGVDSLRVTDLNTTLYSTLLT